MEQLTSQLYSILFVSSKPLSVKQLSKFVHATEQEIEQALKQLAEQINASGIVLLNTGQHYQLATNSINSEVVKNFLNNDLKEELTDATIEVLAIITYRQPISKSELESIRGLNSQYSLRVLLMRGLIEKIPNPNDARGSLYQITTDFLQQLGITSIQELPDFAEFEQKIKLPNSPLIPTSEPGN